MIIIKGLNKAEVLRELYNKSTQDGYGFDITTEQAQEILNKTTLIGELEEKTLCVDLSSDYSFNEAYYDKYNGEGMARKIIADLRKKVGKPLDVDTMFGKDADIVKIGDQIIDQEEYDRLSKDYPFVKGARMVLGNKKKEKTNYEKTVDYIKTLNINNSEEAFVNFFGFVIKNKILLSIDDMGKIMDEYPFFAQCLFKIINNKKALALLEKDGDITPKDIKEALQGEKKEEPKTNYERAVAYIKTLDISNESESYVDLFFYLKLNNYELSNEEYDKISAEYPFITNSLYKLMNNKEFNEKLKSGNGFGREDMLKALVEDKKKKTNDKDNSKKKALKKKDDKNE